jgi:hypothetical protein
MKKLMGKFEWYSLLIFILGNVSQYFCQFVEHSTYLLVLNAVFWGMVASITVTKLKSKIMRW